MKAITKKELRNNYNVSPRTFARMLKLVFPEASEDFKTKKRLEPQHLKIIFSRYGNPLQG